MRSRVVRGTLTLLSVAAIGTAAYYYWTTLARINASLQSASAFTQARAAAAQAAYDLRSAQQAYVAAGQNEAFWFERATRSLEALRAALTALERETTSDSARRSLAEVAAAAEDFESRDRRVRGYVSGGQKLLASDIIFSDGLDLTSRILAGLDAAARHAAIDTANARAAASREQTSAAGAAAVLAMLTLLLLTPTGRPRAEQPLAGTPAGDGILNLELRPAAPASSKGAVPPVRPGKAPAAAVPSTGKTAAAAAARDGAPLSASPAAPRPTVRLEELADVCADLARLSDTSAIPAILERTATALDASGLVLWIADGEGGELLPTAAYGYAPSVLSRMRGLRRDSENATASAFRTGLLQTVRGGRTSSGAIAAPLVSSVGTLGVLSLEMRDEGEKRPERLAAATIVASQLATIVGPPAARTEERNSATI